jgi:hypothetical protein
MGKLPAELEKPWLVLKGEEGKGAWVELCIRGVRTKVKLLITIQHNNHQIKHEGRSHHQLWVKHRDVGKKGGGANAGDVTRRLQRDVVYPWLTNSDLVYEPKCGGRGRVAGYQPMSIAVHRSPNKLLEI